MNLKTLSDQQLLSNVEAAAQRERAVLVEVVRYFNEIERRKLYAVKYSSMFEFATTKLLMSEGQAQRRIDAARLLGELPEIAEKLATGRLNLSHTTLAQKYFRAEKKLGRVPSREDKRKLLGELEGKSSREAEKLIAKRTGQELRRAIRITPTDKERALLERLRDIWAHRYPDGDWTEIVVAAARFTLERVDPLKLAERAAVRKAKKEERSAELTASSVGGEAECDLLESGEVQYRLFSEKRSRYVTAEVAHEAWRRSGGQCEYVAPDGIRCASKHALEREHRVPFALGGDNSAENIRIVCRSHNMLLARKTYGAQWMACKVQDSKAKSSANTISLVLNQ